MYQQCIYNNKRVKTWSALLTELHVTTTRSPSYSHNAVGNQSYIPKSYISCTTPDYTRYS